MTRPRTSITREIFGIIGTLPDARFVQKQWNAFFAHEGVNAFMDYYPTTVVCIPERFSEMFHFDRRLYIVGISLQEAIIPLLDALDRSAEEEGRVECVVNRGGVFTGYYVHGEHSPEEILRSCGFATGASQHSGHFFLVPRDR